jgi:hypothetical protein
MGIRRVRPGDDSKAIGKIYPQDRHAHGYGHPHHDKGHAIRNDGDIERGLRSEQGMKIARNAGPPSPDEVNRMYTDRRRIHGSNPDARRNVEVPEYIAPSPPRSAYSASYDLVKGSPVTPAPSEAAPQFRDDKSADLNDVREAWVRGMGSESPHPKFDSGPSGHRYDRK